jgi:signal transduction histidine kinase
VDGQYIGIITINKNYNELYFSYKNIVGFITMLEFIVFFVIFILGFFMTSKITKPITVLTKAVKQVGDGSYDIEIEVKGKDEVYNNIFDPFIKSKNMREEQSRGLGLYICSEIVKEHYGEITIENGEIIIVRIISPSFGNKLATN